MGCTHSKDHPKNADLIKLKRKYDTEPIKKAKLINIWVIGGNRNKSMELAKLLSERMSYLMISEDNLLQTEMQLQTERAEVIKEIVQDQGTICPGIILDLVVERVLNKLEDLKGIIFYGIPRDREQAWHLQRLIGPVSLVIYCELKGEALRTALMQDGEDSVTTKNKVENFQKSILQLSKHKSTIKIDGESEPEAVLDICLENIKAFTDNQTS